MCLELRVRLAPLNLFKPSSKIFLLTVSRQYIFCRSFVLFMFFVCHVFACVYFFGHLWSLWSLAGKGLASCLCCLVVFLLLSDVVSWVRCGT